MRWKHWQVVMQTVAYNDKEFPRSLWRGRAKIEDYCKVMKRFEYKVVSRLFGVEKKLNQYGFDGWELVAADGGKYIFKREYND